MKQVNFEIPHEINFLELGLHHNDGESDWCMEQIINEVSDQPKYPPHDLVRRNHCAADA